MAPLNVGPSLLVIIAQNEVHALLIVIHEDGLSNHNLVIGSGACRIVGSGTCEIRHGLPHHDAESHACTSDGAEGSTEHYFSTTLRIEVLQMKPERPRRAFQPNHTQLLLSSHITSHPAWLPSVTLPFSTACIACIACFGLTVSDTISHPLCTAGF
jgi:hypothetical protein